MKIFNLQPITIKEYIFNEKYLKESQSCSGLEGGFYFDCKVVDSLKTIIITFEILYTVGGVESQQEIVMSSNSNEWIVMGTDVYEEGAGEILMSYKSYCQFNLENEGLVADILSMSNFLKEYNAHTQSFLNQYKPESLKLEMELFGNGNINSSAMCAIENLKGSNMYEF